MTHTKPQINPALDLVLERVIDVPTELVWQAWTDPEKVKQWITPAPWKTVDCRIDLRPGGVFSLTMQSPEGVNMPETEGCLLEIVENQKLVWTSALGPGYRPQNLAGEGCEALYFTAVITMEPHGTGTKYAATVIHGDEASQKRHAEMGFSEGWGAALDQLVELWAKK